MLISIISKVAQSVPTWPWNGLWQEVQGSKNGQTTPIHIVIQVDFAIPKELPANFLKPDKIEISALWHWKAAVSMEHEI